MRRELICTILDLEEWNQGVTCRFCHGLNKAVCQIRTRSKATYSIVENDYACESCKEKFESNELPKCERCRRLKTKSNIDFNSGEYICDCIKDNEDLEEKELPELPYESSAARYERQINALQEEKGQLEEEIGSHLDALEISEDWHERQKQELLDKIKNLEAEMERTKKENNQAKVVDINKILERIKEIEEESSRLNQEVKQLKELISVNYEKDLESKIEQLPTTKPWKQLFNKKN